MIVRMRNKTGYRLSFKMQGGKLYLENGQQAKFDFMPPLSQIMTNCRHNYKLHILDQTELLDSETVVIDLGIKIDYVD
jgi:hypothetical protein